MALIKNGRLTADRWHRYEDDATLQPDIPAIVSLARFKAERDALLRAHADLGVRLEPGETPDAIADDLGRLVVALDFPSFTDGRAYSYARLLRERYGYKGEVRAVGNVLRDQYLFMARAGFDAFEWVKEGESAEAFLAATKAITNAYQRATDTRRPIWELRGAQPAIAAAAE